MAVRDQVRRRLACSGWIKEGRVTLTTRRGQDWTDKFSPIARELSRLPIRNAILDGEVVVMNPDGTTNFQKLQNILKLEDEGSLVFHAFDLPYYEDHDLSAVPLLERKTMLQELISTYRERIPSVRYTEHLEGSGERVLRAACQYAVEGIIAKRADSPYLQKRTKYWVKKKCISRQEFVIGGFTEAERDPLPLWVAGARLLRCSAPAHLLRERRDRVQRTLHPGRVRAVKAAGAAALAFCRAA